MQLSDINKKHPLVFLSQLPKERVVLDYVLSKLGKNSSPERYDLIAAVFNLHLTSAGFDPMALSKARFKRVKASEFRQALREIDSEIALIIKTEEYNQVLSRQTYLPDLFQQYLQLSATVRQTGAINTSQFHDFANLLREKDASDLMLGFIRQHKNLLETTLSQEDITELLKQIHLLMQDQQRANGMVRSVFELRLNEMLSIRGIRNVPEIYRLWQYFCEQMGLEKSAVLQFELFDKVLRTGILTAWPARNLRSYLGFITDKTESYHFNRFNHRFLLFSKLAEYFTDAGFAQRLHWLDEAEEVARKINNGHLRATCRMIRSRITADQTLSEEAIRFLDEAEYHVYRIKEKDLELKNIWIEIIHTRIVLYALAIVEENAPFHPESFEAQVQLLEDAGRHRSDINLLILEVKGLSFFLQKNWMAAYECYSRAVSIRIETEEDQPMHLIGRFYCELLTKAGQPAKASIELRRLEDGREAFYSYAWARVLVGSQLYYQQNATGDTEM